jgi:hypothetical protein
VNGGVIRKKADGDARQVVISLAGDMVEMKVSNLSRLQAANLLLMAMDALTKEGEQVDLTGEVEEILASIGAPT